MEAKTNHTKTKTAVNGQLFIKQKGKMEALFLEDIILNNGDTVQERFNELKNCKKIIKLLAKKMQAKGYTADNVITILAELRGLEIVSRKKTAQKKTVKKMIDKGVI